MNRLSWDTTAPRRPQRVRDHKPEQREFEGESDILRPGWNELRRIHRF
jgi:hypothetical protein